MVPREVAPWRKPADLTHILTAIHCGCMGLPQELIDQIMSELHDDLTTLNACSLTCKSMFASTRHLLHDHRTLRLCPHALQKPFADLQCTRLVHITPYGDRLTPRLLQPHLHRFQSLDKVHTLVFERYDVHTWANHYQSYFAHFYPTLTSLTLRHPSGTYQSFLQFALQFPNLENLCLEALEIDRGPDPILIVPVDRSPPLCGQLRLVGYYAVNQWPIAPVHGLPSRMNFRSVELKGFFGDRAQHLLNQCSHTLEALTVVLVTRGLH